jgi:hypothetical protein
VSLPIFPSLPGLTFTTLKTPKFDTLIESGANGYEVRLPQYSNPVWTWQLIFDFLHDFFWGSFETVSELRTLMGFFNDQYGSAAAFLYTDPDDNYVGPALVSGEPNIPLAQLALVSDGAGNYYSPVQRTLDGGGYEDVTDLNGAIAVYRDGTLATAGSGANQYALEGPGLAIPGYSWLGMVLKWGPGAASWAGTHAFALNATIIDPAGHIQKATGRAWSALAVVALGYEIIDPAGHVQKITTAGTLGATIPTFNDSGGTTNDGSGGTMAVWTDQGSAGGNAGTSGAAIPTFNDTGGATSDGTGTLVWEDQGYYAGPAAPVTAQFHFYFRVRFDADSQDFEKFAGIGSSAGQPPDGQGGGYWTIGGSESQNGAGTLVLRTARPVPL